MQHKVVVMPPSFAEVVSERLVTVNDHHSFSFCHLQTLYSLTFMLLYANLHIQVGIRDAAGGALSTMSCAHEQQHSARCSFLKFTVQKICRVHIEQVVCSQEGHCLTLLTWFSDDV